MLLLAASAAIRLLVAFGTLFEFFSVYALGRIAVAARVSGARHLLIFIGSAVTRHRDCGVGR